MQLRSSTLIQLCGTIERCRQTLAVIVHRHDPSLPHTAGLSWSWLPFAAPVYEGFSRAASACGRRVAASQDLPAEADHCAFGILDGATYVPVGARQSRCVPFEGRLHEDDQVTAKHRREPGLEGW